MANLLLAHLFALVVLFSLSTSDPIFSFSEKKVLREYYDSQPSKQFTWDFSSSLCGQTGITCITAADGQNHVESILLQAQGLTGSFPEIFTKLRHIRIIDLSNNQLAGTIPPENLYKFYSLRSLRLEGNQLTGTIPNEMRGMQHLENLDLSDNSLTGSIPSDLTSPTLFSLDLSNNQLTGSIPPLFFTPTGLNFLNLSKNQLSGAISTRFAYFASLNTLNLAHNQFSGTIPTELGSLPGLGYLLLNNNNLVGKIPSEITNSFLLGVLHLENNQLSGPLPFFSLFFGTEFSVLGTNKLCPIYDYSFLAESNDYPGSTDCSVCNEFSCLNGGICSDLGSDFTCDCSGLSYEGVHCENAICNPPCANGGSCASPGVCDCGGLGAAGKRILYSGPTCKSLARCPAIIEANGSWNASLPPDRRQGNCLSGFSGRISRQCTPDGTWGPITGACTALSAVCPQLTTTNAHWPETQVDQYASGTCLPGYSGTPLRKCLSANQWDANIWKPCKKNSCPEEQIGNSFFHEASSFQVVYATCLNGTKGRVRRVCQANGTWEAYTGSLCA